MTENVQVSPKMLKNVKEIIETIYEITQTEFNGGFKKEGNLFRSVATILVKRGSLIKSGVKRWSSYKWNPIAMKPTKVFIASVAEEVTRDKAESNRKYKSMKKSKKNTDMNMNQTDIERQKQDAGVVLDNPSIQQYTIQELWDEIKRKGGYIKDNRLAVTTFFD